MSPKARLGPRRNSPESAQTEASYNFPTEKEAA
jgi:hypothetical protein